MANKALLIVVIGLLVLGSMSVFQVHETQKALKMQLGRVERDDYKPGLHFKLPIVETVVKLDGRIQTLDAEPQRFLTFEKKNVIVDSFVKWRIQDVSRYFTSVGGNAQRANDRLSVVVQKLLKDEFGRRTIQQVVSGERAEIMDKLQASLQQQGKTLGITVIDARIKRVDLPDTVSQSVFLRMASERKEVARLFRSEGEERARQIRAEAEREAEIIVAEAERDALKVRGSGDGEATEIYAKSFGKDPEFYSFYRSLQAYRNTFNNRSDILLLKPDNQFFKYFKGSTAEGSEQ